MSTRRWKVLNKIKDKNLNIEEIINILLENRGVGAKEDKIEFLNPRIENFTIENAGIERSEVEKAVARIREAIKKNEQIIIYGDYDVDGICGTAILWETIYKIYKNAMPYIPHRVDEGYGLSIKGIQNLISEKTPGLIITVDNGIVANDAVEMANKNGIDTIITDHHVRADTDPKAFAIIHSTKICGAAVAYLLTNEISNRNEKSNDHLGLAALATVADLVPLTGASRAIVKLGTEKLRKTERPGLLALLNEAQIKKNEIDVYKIGHMIAPRLNASGRIASAMDSLRLICTNDIVRARALAQDLGATNRERQTLTEEATLHASSLNGKIIPDEKLIFVSAEYNPGVIGLVASRLVETYARPVIVVSVSEKISKGSARSVAGFNIIEFIRIFKEYLVDAGGHPMAAGFTVETSKIVEFKSALLAHAEKVILPEHLERTLNIDLELPFEILDLHLFDAFQKLEPFGMGNPEPAFLSKNVKVEDARFVGRDNKHLKLRLESQGKRIDGIFFGAGGLQIKVNDTVDIAYGIDKDTWSGNNKIQLKIKDVKPS